MPLLQQDEIYPAVEFPMASAVEVIATVAVTKLDVVVLNGISGILPKGSPADANLAATLDGVMWIAATAAPVGDKFLAVPWVVVTGVDTSAAGAVGDPVWLKSAAGKVRFTKPVLPAYSLIVVGSVLVDAVDGSYILCPGSASLTFGLTKHLTVTVASGATTSTVKDVGAQWTLANGTITNDTTVAGVYVVKSVIAAGVLTVTVSANPGASGATVMCTIFNALIVETV